MSGERLRPTDAMQLRFSPGRTPDLLAEDVIWRLSGGYPMPRTEWVGREAILGEFLPRLRAQFTAWSAALSTMFEAEGGRVVTPGQYRGTMKDGREVAIPFLHVWTVRDGRIVALDAVADWACMPAPA